MEVKVVPDQRYLLPEHCQNKIVVVIDVFRATSFMVTAFAQGCAWIRTTATIDEARSVYRTGDLLVGERKGQVIDSFDFDNSPLQLQDYALHKRGIILTTTNGTQAIERARLAKQTIAGALLNARSVAKYLAQKKESILLLCAGTRGRFALEDEVAAGYILAHLFNFRPDLQNAKVHDRWLQLYKVVEKHGNSLLKQSESGKRLRQAGKERELAFCLQCDIFSSVPCKHQGEEHFIDLKNL